MSKTLNLQTWDENQVKHIVNKAYRDGSENQLYTDASYIVGNKTFGVGAHIRTMKGARLSFYTGGRSQDDHDFERFYFEDIALLYGLKLCLMHKVRNPIVYIDSQSTYTRYCKAIKIEKINVLTHDMLSNNVAFAHIQRFEEIWTEIRELYYQLKIPRLALIPSHSEIYGNEHADQMAAKGRNNAMRKVHAA